MGTVTIRYWAAAKEAAGTGQQEVSAATLAEALEGALAALDAAAPAAGAQASGSAALAAVLRRSSFLVDGDPVGRRAAGQVMLAEGSVVEVLPPFAGG